MNDIDLAQSLFKKPAEVVKEAFGGRLPTYTVEAEAMADSEGGFVQVQFMGDTINLTDGDPDGAGDVTDEAAESGEAAQWVEVPCSACIKAGDRVLVTIQDGAPIDCVSIGWGDVVSATASQAEAIATATNQHFWSDANGIHVSTDDGDAAGANNILINSLGILLRELTTVLLELSSAGVIVGDQSGTHLSIDSSSVDVLDGNGDELLTMEASGSAAQMTTSRSWMTVGMPYAYATDYANMNLETVSGTVMADLTVGDSSRNSASVNVQAADGNRADASIIASEHANGNTAEVSLSAKASGSSINLSANDVTVNNAAPIVVERKTAITIASTAVRNNASGSASIAKTGYTPVGFQWWWSAGTHQNFFSDYGTHIENDTFYYRFCNLGNANANGTLEYQILYIRDELL